MSDRTSHRRRARQSRTKQARAGIVAVCNTQQDCTPVRPGETPAKGDDMRDSAYNPAWNDTCPSCRSATRYSGGLHHCTQCSYSFPGRRPGKERDLRSSTVKPVDQATVPELLAMAEWYDTSDVTQ